MGDLTGVLESIQQSDPNVAGKRLLLALKSDGKVIARGYNRYRQCPVPTGMSDVLVIP